MTHLREVKDILKETLEKLNLTTDSQKLLVAWREDLGRLAKHAQIGSLREGKLVIEVDSPVYMQELATKRKSIMDRINERMGKKAIVEIRFKLGRIDRGGSED